MTIRITTAAALVATLTAPASFADAHIDLNFKVQACAALEPDDKRLQCYDRIARQHDERGWLRDQFALLANHFEQAAQLLQSGDINSSAREFRSAFAILRQAGRWDTPILSLSGASRSRVTTVLHGAIASEQDVLATCAERNDIDCVVESSWKLTGYYAALQGAVESDMQQEQK